MNANERFEYMAARFYKETNMMAPGKDDCTMSNTREERLEAYREWAEKFYSELFDSQLSSEWISIKDEYPEPAQGNKVLGFGNGYAFECEFDEGFWCNIGGEEMTHWMSLPEQPQRN